MRLREGGDKDVVARVGGLGDGAVGDRYFSFSILLGLGIRGVVSVVKPAVVGAVEMLAARSGVSKGSANLDRVMSLFASLAAWSTMPFNSSSHVCRVSMTS